MAAVKQEGIVELEGLKIFSHKENSLYAKKFIRR